MIYVSKERGVGKKKKNSHNYGKNVDGSDINANVNANLNGSVANAAICQVEAPPAAQMGTMMTGDLETSHCKRTAYAI